MRAEVKIRELKVEIETLKKINMKLKSKIEEDEDIILRMHKKINKSKLTLQNLNNAVKMVKEVNELMNDQLYCNMSSGSDLFLS